MFNPEDNFINWKSLIDIKNYDDFYKGKEKRLFCNWTCEQVIEFAEKYRQLKNLDEDKKNLLIESIKDIIDFGLGYQKDFFENYDKENYYYNLGLETLIPKIESTNPTLEEIIDKLRKENQEEDNTFNNCLYEKNQYEKIKKFIESVRTLSEQLKTKSDSEITIWAKNVKKYFKDKRSENKDKDIKSDDDEDEEEKKEKISNKNDKINKNMNSGKFKNLLSIFDPALKKNSNIPQIGKENQTKLEEKKNEITKKEKLYKKEEILAYINLGFDRIFGFPLRDTQLISIYILINKKKNIGRIIQVLTGEGKTCIIIGLAIYLALRGN